jgi:hypothetical protein
LRGRNVDGSGAEGGATRLAEAVGRRHGRATAGAGHGEGDPAVEAESGSGTRGLAAGRAVHGA